MMARTAEPDGIEPVNTHAARVAFGQRLRELRVERGISQDGLARRASVHPTAIGRMERGGREPRLTTILRLARALQAQPGELLDEQPAVAESQDGDA
jgi:transcriptional regulator with XRE-family HTH domain